MTEEKVTKAILSYLIENEWEIISFDFPQSGTGILLQPDDSYLEKSKGAIIPDIVAAKNKICLFFENKDKFYYPDYIKINELITKDTYKKAIMDLISKHHIHTIYYGIGLPTSKYSKRANEFKHLVDFVVGVNDDCYIKTIYDNYSIFR